MSSRIFATFSVVLLVLGGVLNVRHLQLTLDRPALKRECHSKTAARLKECSPKPQEAFQEFR
jgi:hypothetical protein